MVDVAGIPAFRGSLDAVVTASVGLRVHAAKLTAHATELNVGWQGLDSCYSAPEGAGLRAATGPVESGTREVGRLWSAVADALDRFVDDVGPLLARLDVLRAQAHAYDGVDTSSEVRRTREENVRDHNHLLAQIDHTVAAWEEAQRRCANAINAQDTSVCRASYRADDGDGVHGADEFGYTAKAFDTAATHGGVPWGKSVKQAHAWTRDPEGAMGQVAIGFGKGAWNFGRTVTAMAIPETDPERANAGYELMGALVLSTNPQVREVNEDQSFLGLPAGSITHAQEEFGKSFISYDEWKENPDQALRENIFTALTFVGTDGVGAGARGLSASRGFKLKRVLGTESEACE